MLKKEVANAKIGLKEYNNRTNCPTTCFTIKEISALSLGSIKGFVSSLNRVIYL